MNLDQHLKDEVKEFLQQKLRDEQEVITVISAHKLTSGQEKELGDMFPKRVGSFRQEVDDSLIAGIIVKRGSRVLDLSVKGRLQQLANQIINT